MTIESASLNTPLANQISVACSRLGIGRTAIYKLIADGQLRTVKIAGRVLIPESELQRVLAEAMRTAA